MKATPADSGSMLSEVEALRKELDAQPDSSENRELRSALARMQTDLAKSRRLDLALESHERVEASKLMRGGFIALGLGLTAMLSAIAAAVARPTIQVLPYSAAGVAIGVVLILSGIFVLTKRRMARNPFSRRDWEATSLIEALRLRSPPRTVTRSPKWQNKNSDRRIVKRTADYEPTIQPLISELIALIPDAWHAFRATIDCDAISIRCRFGEDGDALGRTEPSPALLHFCAKLYVHMGRIGDRWSACSIICRRSNRAWSYEIEFDYVGPFPTPGYLTPRSISDKELEEAVTYFEERGKTEHKWLG